MMFGLNKSFADRNRIQRR